MAAANSDSPAPLDAHLGFWLRLVSNHVSQAFAARLADHDVTVAEWSLMRTLYGVPPLPPSQLAAHMAMTRGAITRLADRLIAKALVVRTASAVDGRAQTLALTAAGAALVPKLAAVADANDRQFFSALSAAEQATLRALLQRLAQRGGMTGIPTD